MTSSVRSVCLRIFFSICGNSVFGIRGKRQAVGLSFARACLRQSGKIAANYKKNDDPSMERAKTKRAYSRHIPAFCPVCPAGNGGGAGDGGDGGDDGAGSRSGCRTGRVRKKKNVRPCSRTFRCSSLSLSVSWRRERLFWLKIKYLPPNKIQGRIFCVTEWPSLNFRVAPCFAYGTAKIGNKMNNPNFSALIFFLFLGGGKKSVKSTKKMPRERRFPGRFLYYI